MFGNGPNLKPMNMNPARTRDPSAISSPSRPINLDSLKRFTELLARAPQNLDLCLVSAKGQDEVERMGRTKRGREKEEEKKRGKRSEKGKEKDAIYLPSSRRNDLISLSSISDAKSNILSHKIDIIDQL